MVNYYGKPSILFYIEKIDKSLKKKYQREENLVIISIQVIWPEKKCFVCFCLKSLFFPNWTVTKDSFFCLSQSSVYSHRLSQIVSKLWWCPSVTIASIVLVFRAFTLWNLPWIASPSTQTPPEMNKAINWKVNPPTQQSVNIMRIQFVFSPNKNLSISLQKKDHNPHHPIPIVRQCHKCDIIELTLIEFN